MAFIDVLKLFGEYFFPIVACVLLGWYVKYKDDKNREDLKDIISQHKEESEKFAEALNKNTMVLQELTLKLGERNEKE